MTIFVTENSLILTLAITNSKKGISAMKAKEFVSPKVALEMVNKVKGLEYNQGTNSLASKTIYFDLNYGIAYCNGQIAFRKVAGTSLLAKSILGSKKELFTIKKILKKLDVPYKEISCRYGLGRINEEIQDLILEKINTKKDGRSLVTRAKLNNQISFLRQIGALVSLQDEIDNKKAFPRKVSPDEKLIRRASESNEVKRIKNLIRI